MKKTEKIEVRLSHEEKSALTELAEQESRSVSDLVRGLIERYMSINTTRLPRKTPWLIFTAIAIGGFFAGHLATYFIAKSHSASHSSIYNMSVNFDGDGISFPLLEKASKTQEFVIPSQDGDIRISPIVEKKLDGPAVVFVELCREEKTGCQEIAAPKLQFNPNRQSSISFEVEEGRGVFITLNKSLKPDK